VYPYYSLLFDPLTSMGMAVPIIMILCDISILHALVVVRHILLFKTALSSLTCAYNHLVHVHHQLEHFNIFFRPSSRVDIKHTALVHTMTGILGLPYG
jgi:hypothetical protein